jgi:copper chaperone CopZ
MEPIRLTIERAGAPGAAAAVEDALRMVPGVLSARVQPHGNDVVVEAADNVDPEELIAAAQKAGFTATLAG